MLIPPLLIQSKQPFTIAEVADGAEALAAAEVARAMFRSGADIPALALMVTRDAVRAQAIEQAFAFFAPRSNCCSCPLGTVSPTTAPAPAPAFWRGAWRRCRGSCARAVASGRASC